MMKRIGLATGLLVLFAGAGFAQEARTPDVPSLEDPTVPLHHIRVLQHPYDIASFYRSRQGSEGTGFFDTASDRYPIASFYRSRQSGPYGSFWVGGYGSQRTGKGALGIGYRRSIGENGDLYLFAPAFLAPFGRLSGAFLER